MTSCSTRRPRRLAAALVLCTAAACAVSDVETTPFDGPQPAAVLVLPVRNLTGMPVPELPQLAEGADRALASRGYRVLPLGIGFDLARRSGLVTTAEPDPAALFALYRSAAMDAVLVVELEHWAFEGEPAEQAEWAMAWRLLATEDGRQLWQHREAGSWVRPPSPTLDPTRSLDAEPEVQPFGTLRPAGFRSPRELAVALHNTAMAHLPRRE